MDNSASDIGLVLEAHAKGKCNFPQLIFNFGGNFEACKVSPRMLDRLVAVIDENWGCRIGNGIFVNFKGERGW